MARLPLALVADDLKAGRLVLAGVNQDSIRFEVRLYKNRHSALLQLQKIWDAST